MNWKQAGLVLIPSALFSFQPNSYIVILTWMTNFICREMSMDNCLVCSQESQTMEIQCHWNLVLRITTYASSTCEVFSAFVCIHYHDYQHLLKHMAYLFLAVPSILGALWVHFILTTDIHNVIMIYDVAFEICIVVICFNTCMGWNDLL